jgi:hypothetical protein
LTPPSLLSRGTQPTASNAEIRGSLEEVDGIIKLARSEGIKLDPSVVERYGKRVAALQNVSTDPRLRRLLDYRSALNVDAQPSLPKRNLGPPNPDIIAHLRFGNLRATQPAIATYGIVPSAQSAVLNFIGEHLNLEHSTGAAFIVLQGDELILDGLEMKNVILRNVSIRYYGGRVTMENVYFVNCTFTFPPPSTIPVELKQFQPIQPSAPFRGNTQLFADRVLESPAITFGAS